VGEKQRYPFPLRLKKREEDLTGNTNELRDSLTGKKKKKLYA